MRRILPRLAAAIRRDPRTAAVWLAIGLLHLAPILALLGCARSTMAVAALAVTILYGDLIAGVRAQRRPRP